MRPICSLDGKRVTDWKAFTEHTGGSAAVYLKDPQDKATLTDPCASAAAFHRLFRHRLYQIVEKEELVKLGGPPDVAFYLEGELGNMLSGAVTCEFIHPAPVKGNHGYLPTKPGLQTGFLIAGRGVKKGAVLETIRLVDVAPTIAQLLGLEMKDTDGHALTELLR